MTADFILRPAGANDFEQVYILYKELVGRIDVASGPEGEARFRGLLSHPGTTILTVDLGGQLVSMVTLHILPNMTFSGRPYALVENVVTLTSHRGLGLSRAVMQQVAQMAWRADAYKIMLLTGQDAGARGFYEKLGYTADDKFGMTLRRAPKRQPS